MNPSITPHSAVSQHGMSSSMVAVIIATIMLLYGAYVPKKITVATDVYCSPLVRARICALFTPHHIAVMPINALYKDINKIVAGVSAIEIVHDRPHHATLLVRTMAPCAVVNNQYVLTRNGTLVSLDEYGSEILRDLPHVIVIEEFFSQESCRACTAWVMKLPAEILELFTISWYARSHIELVPRDKNLSSLVFITWCYAVFTPEMMAAMKRVAQKNKRIDLRVPRYAIVSPILRGNL